jgi:signal recognition particle subunit SRP72
MLTMYSIPDPSTRKIAQIDKLVVDSRSSNPYLAHRIFHSGSKLPKTDPLFDFQEALSQQDEFALDLLASRFSSVAKSTGRLLSDDLQPTLSSRTNAMSSVNAAARAQNQLGEMGIKSILPLLEERPKDAGLVLTIVQLYMLTKNHGAAIKVVESFFKRLEESSEPADQDVRFAPGLVAVLTSLYSAQGRKSHIRIELAKAASYWRHKSKSPPSLLRAAGLALLKSERLEDLQGAGDIFEGLHRDDPEDGLATAGLVAAYSATDPSKLSDEADRLPPVGRLTAGIDVAALEAAGVPQPASTASIISRKRAAGEKAKPAKKRLRKSRLPKDYDPDKKPDPERWLPLRDRSTYRPKGKKGKQKAQALTQGGVDAKAAEGLNVADDAAKPGGGVVGGGGGGGGAKAKKKKNKR